MTPILLSPLWLFMLVLAIAIITTRAARRHRMLDNRRFDIRVCGHCGSSQPAHAVFCPSCGKRL